MRIAMTTAVGGLRWRWGCVLTSTAGHSHGLEDLSVGLWILLGIVLFLVIEKAVRLLHGAQSGPPGVLPLLC